MSSSTSSPSVFRKRGDLMVDTGTPKAAGSSSGHRMVGIDDITGFTKSGTSLTIRGDISEPNAINSSSDTPARGMPSKSSSSTRGVQFGPESPNNSLKRADSGGSSKKEQVPGLKRSTSGSDNSAAKISGFGIIPGFRKSDSFAGGTMSRRDSLVSKDSSDGPPSIPFALPHSASADQVGGFARTGTNESFDELEYSGGGGQTPGGRLSSLYQRAKQARDDLRAVKDGVMQRQDKSDRDRVALAGTDMQLRSSTGRKYQYDTALKRKQSIHFQQVRHERREALHRLATTRKLAEELNARSKYVVNPEDSQWARRIQLASGFCLVIICFSLPFELVFLEIEVNWLFWVNRVIDVVFVAEIMLNFFCMYHVQTLAGSHLVTDHSKIIRHYLSTWFIIDFLAVFPFAPLYLMTKNDFLASATFLRHIRVIRLVRLGKLLRLAAYARGISVRLSFTHSKQTLLKFMWILIVAAHWLACSWGYVGSHSNAYRYTNTNLVKSEYKTGERLLRMLRQGKPEGKIGLLWERNYRLHKYGEEYLYGRGEGGGGDSEFWGEADVGWSTSGRKRSWLSSALWGETSDAQDRRNSAEEDRELGGAREREEEEQLYEAANHYREEALNSWREDDVGDNGDGHHDDGHESLLSMRTEDPNSSSSSFPLPRPPAGTEFKDPFEVHRELFQSRGFNPFVGEAEKKRMLGGHQDQNVMDERKTP